MRNSIYSCILVNLLLLTFATIVSECRVLPISDSINYGYARYPHQWYRWCEGDYDCGRGFCRAQVCQCLAGYLTWDSLNVCAYDQRKKLTAFLLSFFLGTFGVDWFYLARGNAGYIIAGIIKALISGACCIGWPFMCVNTQRKSWTQNRLVGFVNTILTIMSLIWWLIDWIRILADVFYDGNRAPLQAWGPYHIYSKIPYIV